MKRFAPLIGLMMFLFTAPAQANPLAVADLGCESTLPEGTEFRITYGPFWDGAWQLSVIREPGAPYPFLQVDTLEVIPAAFTVQVTASHRRPTSDHDIRMLREASSVMIGEMQVLAEERPELPSEQKPLVIQVRMSQGASCAQGFVNWPRLPGTYYFEAVEILRTAVMQPEVLREPWPAVRLHLRSVRAPWQR